MSALFLNAQELDLLNCFNSFDVHYLVTGGHAVQFHGHLRLAKDFDIFIDRSDGNPVRVVSALRSLGFFGSDLSANLFSELKNKFRSGGTRRSCLLRWMVQRLRRLSHAASWQTRRALLFLWFRMTTCCSRSACLAVRKILQTLKR
jgi:hypothetical protein